MKKYATLNVLSVRRAELAGHKTAASAGDADFLGKLSLKEKLQAVAEAYQISSDPKNYLLVIARAVTADVPNENGDAFSEAELLRFDTRIGCRVFETFRNKPLHVQHRADDPIRARGFIVDARYDTSKADDKYVEVVIAVDASKDPLLAQSLEGGQLRSFSMGCDCQRTRCNVCGKVAYKEADFCAHIKPGSRMQMFAGDDGVEKKAYEWCEGVCYQELSVVGTPADPNALTREILALRASIDSLSRQSVAVETSQLKMVADLQEKLQDVEAKLAISGDAGRAQDGGLLSEELRNKNLKQRHTVRKQDEEKAATPEEFGIDVKQGKNFKQGMEERGMNQKFARLYQDVRVDWTKKGSVVVSNKGRRVMEITPPKIEKLGGLDFLKKILASIAEKGMHQTAKLFAGRRIADDTSIDNFEAPPKKQLPLSDKEIPIENVKPDSEGYAGKLPSLRPEAQRRARLLRAKRLARLNALKQKSLKRRGEEVDTFAKPPVTQQPIKDSEIPFEDAKIDNEGYEGGLPPTRAQRLAEIRRRRGQSEGSPFEKAPKKQMPLSDKEVPFEKIKPESEGYAGPVPATRKAKLQAILAKFKARKEAKEVEIKQADAQRQKLAEIKQRVLARRQKAQLSSDIGGVTKDGKDDMRTTRSGPKSSILEDYHRDLRSPRPKDKSISDSVLDSRMTDRRAEKIKQFRDKYATLADRKAKILAKKEADLNLQRLTRAVKLAATRQRLNVDADGCILKSALFEALTSEVGEYPGMDGLMAYQLIQAAFDNGLDQFISDIIVKGQKLMELSPEAFSQIEADAKGQAAAPLVVEDSGTSVKASRESVEESASALKVQAAAGNSGMLRTSNKEVPVNGRSSKSASIGRALSGYNVYPKP